MLLVTIPVTLGMPLGCFHYETNASTCNDVLTQSVETALVQLLAFLCARYGMVPTNIKGHKDFTTPLVLGSNLYPRLPGIAYWCRASLVRPLLPPAEKTLRSDQPTPPATSGDRWSAALRRASPTGASAVTAAQDGLQPGINAFQQMARTDLQRVLALKDAFVLSGKTFYVPPALLAAIASRDALWERPRGRRNRGPRKRLRDHSSRQAISSICWGPTQSSAYQSGD